MKIKFHHGKAVMIYSDEQTDLMNALGSEQKVTRASNVEPTGDGRWQAVMVDGMALAPTKKRQESLDQEVKYIEENFLS